MEYYLVHRLLPVAGSFCESLTQTAPRQKERKRKFDLRPVPLDSGPRRGRIFLRSDEGGSVRCQVRDNGKLVFVEMGKGELQSTDIPVAGAPREVVAEHFDIGGEALQITGVSVGNPHCVVHVDDATPELAHRLGPLIENHEMFPNRTNVQFVKVLGPQRIRIKFGSEVLGTPLASGSSSCAAAAASVRLDCAMAP